MQKLAVVDGAVLKCIAGTEDCSLTVTTKTKTRVDDARLATIRDHEACINISNFGDCKITGGPCGPVTPDPWLSPVTKTVPGRHPVLVEGGILLCHVGSVIQIKNPGQPFFKVGVRFPPGLADFIAKALEYARLRVWLAERIREGDAQVEDMKAGASFLADMIPVGGTLKGWVEAATGKDAFTGQDLATWQRVLGAVPLVGKYGRRGVEVVDTSVKGVKKAWGWAKGKIFGKPKPKPKPPRPDRMYVPRHVADKVPPTWHARPTRTPGGVEFYNPRFENQTIRYMPGNPHNPHPNSRRPYVKVTDKAGRTLQADGTLTPAYHDPKTGKTHPPGNKYHPAGHQPAADFRGNLGE